MDFLFIAGGIYVKFTIGDTYHGFKLQSEEFINEIGSTARVFYHTKSGARLLHQMCIRDSYRTALRSW